MTKIYDRQDEDKTLIFFKEKVNGIKEFEIFYSRMAAPLGWLGCRGPRLYLHALLTNQDTPLKSSYIIKRRQPRIRYEEEFWWENELIEENV